MTRVSARYLARRLVASYLTLLVVMTVLFLLVRSLPGTVVTSMITPEMTPQQVARLEAEWAVGEPTWRTYLEFMVNYQTFDFGRSPTYRAPVAEVLLGRLPRTLILFGAAFLVGYVVGPLVGMYLGWWRGTVRDKAVFGASLLAYSMPVFWIAWLFVWLFDHELGWLPSAYMITPFPAETYGPSFTWTARTVVADVLRHVALPLFSLVFVGWVGAMLVMRPQMNNVVGEDYVFLARAKGLPERTVMVKHAARNALIPVVTQAVVALAFLLDGSVIVENVFSWPGLGQVVVGAVFDRDYPVMQAAFFLLALLVIALRLLTDVLYTYLDPRISFGETS